jgi:DNA-directed RNA polymerase subunit RPC12/RpoP
MGTVDDPTDLWRRRRVLDRLAMDAVQRADPGPCPACGYPERLVKPSPETSQAALYCAHCGRAIVVYRF